MAEKADPRKRLHRLLKRDLGTAVTKTDRGTWTTTSNLPHEIQLHVQAAVPLVRVSAGMVLDVKATKTLLKDVNLLNTMRAFSRRIIVDGKVLMVAEMPVASLRKGDLESVVSMVLCCARLDAPLLAVHGGRSVTDPPPSLAPDYDRVLDCWLDVLQASGTATERELAVWLDDVAGCNCWIDCDDDNVFVVVDGTGIGSTYPFTLRELRDSAQELADGSDEDD